MGELALKGRELIPIAKSLARGSASGPLARSAVNRAYYAAYTELTQYVKRHGYSYAPNRRSHERAWNFLLGIRDGSTRRDAERRVIRDQGIYLKEQRRNADYRPESKMAAAAASDAVRSAQGIVSALDRLIP